MPFWQQLTLGNQKVLVKSRTFRGHLFHKQAQYSDWTLEIQLMATAKIIYHQSGNSPRSEIEKFDGRKK